jgi:hypothetical protein
LLIAQVEYLGFEVIDGVYCQRFEIIEQGMIAGQRITLYEDYQKKRAYRIEYANFVWRFDELELLEEDNMPVPATELDIDSILSRCDPNGIEPPTQIVEGVLTNAITVEETWGGPETAALRHLPDGAEARQLLRKSLEQYKSDNWNTGNQTMRRSGSKCFGVSIDAPALGLALESEFCKDEKFEFSMVVDGAAPQKLKQELLDNLPDGPGLSKIKDKLEKIGCMCPEVGGEVHAMVPFDPSTDVEAGGKVIATFPAGCCLKTYGPPNGIPPQVGELLDQLGTKIIIEFGVLHIHFTLHITYHQCLM